MHSQDVTTQLLDHVQRRTQPLDLILEKLSELCADRADQQGLQQVIEHRLVLSGTNRWRTPA